MIIFNLGLSDSSPICQRHLVLRKLRHRAALSVPVSNYCACAHGTQTNYEVRGRCLRDTAMTTLNSTFGPCDVNPHEADMSCDGSLIDKESPPQFVTVRRGTANPDALDLRKDFQTFQSTMMNMLERWFERQDEKFAAFITDFNDIKDSITFMNGNISML